MFIKGREGFGSPKHLIAHFPVEKTWVSSYQDLRNLNSYVGYKELCITIPHGTESHWRAAAIPLKSMEIYELLMMFGLIIYIHI